jgi:hypothetical protein
MSATNRGTVRNVNDFYPTPDITTESILQEMDLSTVKTFLEPCRGSGAIMRYFSKFETQYAELNEGIDYLSTFFSPVDLIITNPPFNLAVDFLTKSLTEGTTVVYLLRLNFLGSQKRKEFWQANPVSHLFVLSKRPSFTGNGTYSIEYAWFVWDRGCVMKRPPGIYVI